MKRSENCSYDGDQECDFLCEDCEYYEDESDDEYDEYIDEDFEEDILDDEYQPEGI